MPGMQHFPSECDDEYGYAGLAVGNGHKAATVFERTQVA